MASPGGGPVLYFIPHTHWEGAVFKTRDQYLDMGLPNILRALALLEAHPNFRFTLDQVCYVRPFLERFPEEAARFRQFVREGRLGIVGGTDVMLDVNMPGGESFIRQVLYGKRFFRQKLGVDVTVCWQLDTFGHHAQMPQLLAQAGFRSFWFFRGVPSWETPAEFLWEGIDGTRVPAYWLPHGYALSYGSPATVPEFGRFVDERYHMLDPFSKRDRRVAPGGADVCEPEGHLPAVAAAHNAQPDIAVAVELATPQEYEAAVPIDDIRDSRRVAIRRVQGRDRAITHQQAARFDALARQNHPYVLQIQRAHRHSVLQKRSRDKPNPALYNNIIRRPGQTGNGDGGLS